jgi:predicted nucleic acid-binding protein
VRLAVDTNIFVYAEGLNGLEQAVFARRLLEDLPLGETVVPVQVLGELFNVLVRKGNFSRTRARDIIAGLAAAFETADTSSVQLDTGSELAERYGLNIWEAIILAVSDSAGCRILLSEDMQHCFEWRGVTVINPFLAEPHPLLRRAFER